MRVQRKAYFDPWADPVLRQFPCLPRDLEECFSDTSRPTPFITRWKALTDEAKHRFLRFAKYVDGVNEERMERVYAE